MNILAIETSCDDTCLALVRASGKKRPKFKILSSIVSSQNEIHKKWGGVYPTLAKREHEKNLPIILKKALFKRGPTSQKLRSFNRGRASNNFIDLIAVTIGPGLEPCLWTGINFAKSLALKLNVPVVPINHIEAHILASFAGSNSKFQIPNFKKIFPAICLVVSGGHTQLILMRAIGEYKILGETRDDAAGECFDKTARILGLGYPGGPAIAAEAAKEARPPKALGGRASFKLPRPMLNQKNYDFSFSGLKTAVLYSFKNYLEGAKLPAGSLAPSKKLSSFKRAMAEEIQQAIIDVLIKKTIKAAKDFRAKSIILGGGVAANDELRKQIKKKFNNVILPPKKFCTDNAIMTAIAGYFGKPKPLDKIRAEANLMLK